MTLLDTKGRTPYEYHRARIAWRKKIVDENFPEMCSCRIGKSPATRSKRTKCCEIMSCGMSVKNAYVTEHRKKCKVCSDVNGPPVSGVWPLGEPIVPRRRRNAVKI